MSSSWEHDDFFIFLAYLVDNLLLSLGHFTFPLSTFLALWQVSFLVLFCVSVFPLDSFVFFYTLLCFNNRLHQWSTCFMASGWVWPVGKGCWGDPWEHLVTGWPMGRTSAIRSSLPPSLPLECLFHLLSLFLESAPTPPTPPDIAFEIVR